MERVRALIIVTILGIVGVAACVALIISLTSLQSSRERAAHDSCELLRHIVLAATPPAERAQAVGFLYRNGLDDARGRDRCPQYASHLVS